MCGDVRACARNGIHGEVECCVVESCHDQTPEVSNQMSPSSGLSGAEGPTCGALILSPSASMTSPSASRPATPLAMLRCVSGMYVTPSDGSPGLKKSEMSTVEGPSCWSCSDPVSVELPTLISTAYDQP